VPQSISTATSNVGFITALNEAGAYAGGYLVTNEWGRPLEFRVSTRVMPTRVQNILYGETLEPYVLADLIGRNLFGKTATTVAWVVTDQRAFLELRAEIDVPLVWVANAAVEPRERSPAVLRVPCSGDRYVYCHEDFSNDVEPVQSHLARCRFDLLEPFERVISAIQESERLGVLKDAGAKA
jgi:hypothetical protein